MNLLSPSPPPTRPIILESPTKKHFEFCRSRDHKHGDDKEPEANIVAEAPMVSRGTLSRSPIKAAQYLSLPRSSSHLKTSVAQPSSFDPVNGTIAVDSKEVRRIKSPGQLDFSFSKSQPNE